MSKTYLSLKLDGDAHKSHTVKATQLISALQGFVESVIDANQVLNGHAAVEPDIKIEAFNPGSFEALVVVEYAGQLIETAKNFNPLEYIGFAVGAPVAHGVARTAIELLRRLEGKTPEPVQSTDGEWSLNLGDGNSIDLPDEKLIELLDSPKFRKGMEKLFQDPLKFDGTDFISIGVVDEVTKKSNPDNLQIVKQSESNFFRAEVKGITVRDDEDVYKTSVYFTKVNFKSGKSWEIELPTQVTQKVEVIDKEFLAKTLKRYNERKTAISSDALFEIELKVVTKINTHGAVSSKKYYVTKVYKQLTMKET